MTEPPDWPRFAKMTATPELLEAMEALGFPDPPPEGRPLMFRAHRNDDKCVGINVAKYKDLGTHGTTVFITCADGGTRLAFTAAEVRKTLKLTAGTSSRKALDRWLAWWGLT